MQPTKPRRVAPISVAMIVRNEEAGLADCLESIRPHVAEIVIVDTGSTDSSPKIAKKYANKIVRFDGCNDKQGRIRSFARARNRAHELAGKPWVMWLDGDDVVVHGELLPDLIASVEEKMGPSPCRIQMPYAITSGPSGWTNDRERIVRSRDDFEWKGAVHETLCPKMGVNFLETRVADCWIEHRPKKEKVREENRNLRILETELAEKGFLEPREMYYLARQYSEIAQVVDAIRWMERYVEVSRFPEEKCLAFVQLSELYLMRIEHDKAVVAALRAHATCEFMGAPLVQLAKCFYLLANRNEDRYENFRRAAYFGTRAIETGAGARKLFHNPLTLLVEVHRYLNVARFQTNDTQGALKSVDMALEHAPNDVQLLMNQSFYRERLGDLPGALESLEKAIAVAPENTDLQEKKNAIVARMPTLKSAEPVQTEAIRDHMDKEVNEMHSDAY